MKQRVDQIIEEMKDIISLHQLNVSDNTLFSEAISCWRGEQVGKNYNSKPSNITSPSEKQLALLKKNEGRLLKKGIKLESIKTKFEASKIIDGLINK